jgi:parallel beta-helix repeat protein
MISNNALNNYYGIFLSNSNNNTVRGNNASKNNIGISLWYSSNNRMIDNNFLNNIKGIELSSLKTNKIYNNLFNNTNNSYFYEDSDNNTWNTTKQSGTNIIGGSFLGGNFWANPEGTGFSQTCPDVNGDGICDTSYTLNENNIDYLPLSMNFKKDTSPPKSVSNLKNVTYAKNFINWTWTDPKNIDLKKVMVFIDDKFKKNVSKGKMYYNATNLTVNTRHTISTRTVDMNGNINKTWVNHSAWTAK